MQAIGHRPACINDDDDDHHHHSGLAPVVPQSPYVLAIGTMNNERGRKADDAHSLEYIPLFHSEKTDIKASRKDELVFPSNRLLPALSAIQRGLQHERSPGTQVSPREASLALPICRGQGEPSCTRSNELWRSMVSALATLLSFVRSDSSFVPLYLIISLPRIISFAIHSSF